MAKKIPPEISNLKPKTGNPQSLRVLVVEDSEDDALLIIRELKKGGYDPAYERVETASAMKKALKEKQWDIILCDYRLPKFNAPSAIAVLKDTDIDIPLIIVSGTIGEETAVECMRLGAKDYIMKNNLSRLCPAIERELKETESRAQSKQAEEALKESENKYRNLYDFLPISIFEIDTAGTIISFNPASLKTFGYKQEDFKDDMTALQFFMPEDWNRFAENIQKVIDGTSIPGQEYIFLRKDGSTFPGLIYASTIIKANKTVGIRGAIIDITERNQAEEKLRKSEKKYRELYDFLPIPVYEMDLEANITSANRAVYEIFRGTEEDLKKGFKVWQIISPEEMKKSSENIQLLLKGEQVEGTEYTLTRLDGSVFPAIVISSVIYSEGKPVGLRGAIIDITERKQAEESLRKSEEKYRNIIENMQEGYFENDLAGNFTFVNDAECRNLGYPKEELIGMNNRQYQDETNAQKTYQLFKTLYRTGEPLKALDVEIIRKNGTKGFNEVSVSLVRDTEGKPIGFWGISRDVTERKQAEETLRESEERYKALFDRSLDFVYITDFEGRFLDANAAALNRLGYTREDIPSLNFASLLSEDQLLLAFKELQKIRETGIQMGLLELRLRHKDGSEVYVETQGSTVMSNGIPVAMQQIARDITERKRAEEELRASESRYRILFEASADGILIADFETQTFKYSNKALCRLLGYTEEELRTLGLADIHPKQDLQRVIAEFEALVRGDKNLALDIPCLRKDGRILYVDINATNITIDGKICVVGIFRDITERKRMEEVLKTSEERFRTAAESLTDVIYDWDIKEKVDWYGDIDGIMGYPRGGFPRTIKGWEMTIHPEDKDRVMAALEGHLKGVAPFVVEYRVGRRDGEWRWWSARGTALRDDRGEPCKMIGSITDITERKRAEQALRESEAQYRLLADNMQDQVWLMDMNLKPTYISPSVEKIRGYTFAEIAQLPLDKQLTATSLQSAMEFFSIEMPKALADPTYFALPLELEFYCKDGSTLWVESTFSQVRDENGKPLSLLGVGRNITERKRAEEELRKSEHLHRIITNSIRDTVALLDINFRATWINPSVTKTLGFTLDELAQVPLERQVTPDSMQRMQDLMLEHLTAENLADKNKELNVTGEFEFYRKNGDIFWDEMNISLLRDADGKPTGFLTVGRDVTERKHAEEEHKQSFERMRKALKATVQAISLTVEMKDPYTSGHQQRVADLARAIATEMGLSADRQDFIRTASTIHDIGKIAIPSEILSKPTKLTDLEFSLIKTHAQSGYDILKDIEFPWPVADVVLQHHERMDGSGYPQGLKGDDILLEARILAIADVVEAIASHRPYRPALGIDLALEDISRNKGILYDADAVDACLKLFREKGYTLVLKNR